jgi:hypothetical protein
MPSYFLVHSFFFLMKQEGKTRYAPLFSVLQVPLVYHALLFLSFLDEDESHERTSVHFLLLASFFIQDGRYDLMAASCNFASD